MKPILFNTEMVNAILDGRKTVTRRIVKPQPDSDQIYKLGYVIAGDRKDIGKFGFGVHESGGRISYAKPPYEIGDILYARESQSIHRVSDCGNKFVRVHYKADNAVIDYVVSDAEWERLSKYDYTDEKFISPYWTTKETTRIWLKITDVRVERLREMGDEGALKEGCTGIKCSCNGSVYACTNCYNTGWIEPPELHFWWLWNSTIKKSEIEQYGYVANPWVWVIEFERIEKPEIKEDTQ